MVWTSTKNDGGELFEKDDPSFYGDYSLISTDQGIRGFLFTVNDLCCIQSEELGLENWRWDSVYKELTDKPHPLLMKILSVQQ